MAEDRVVLTVPARGEFARTVRMTAAEVASRIGMSYDEVDDIRIAAEEAFVYAGNHVEDVGEVTFTFMPQADQLEVAVGPLSEGCAEGSEDEMGIGYARFILESVCDEFDVTTEGARCFLHLVKRVTAE